VNAHLTHHTFLVGERISLADIVVAAALYRLYKMVFEPTYRKAFPNVTRWYLTVVNQPNVKSVIGEVELCEKMAVAEPSAHAPAPQKAAEPKPKQQPKKKASEEEEADDDDVHEEKKEKKGSNPLDLLPPSKINLDEWKRTYSNNDARQVALPWFWDHLDDGWSIWFSDYKYNNECTKLFMTNNLVGGWMQRLDKFRKYGFGSVLIFGEEPNLQVAGCWLVRGQETPAELKESDDYEHHTWRKADLSNAKDKSAVEDFWAWNGQFEGRPSFNDQGKVFK